MLPSRVGGLFMGMGTGKSFTSIELARIRRQKIDKVLWFCPVSLKRTVRDEILKHTDCDPDSICVFDERTSVRRLPDAWWYICGIETISASDRTVLAVNQLITDRTFVVCDEGSYIKGHRSKRTCRLTDYAAAARYRLLLNGTPLTQGVIDLYAQMRFLSPKILGYRSFYSFARNHLEYHPKYPRLIVRSLDTEVLAAKIAPYVYQVTKDECLDLPPKIFKSRYFYMTDEQRQAYRQAKEEILGSLLDSSEFELMYAIFRLFTALQQIVCGFWSRRDDPDEALHREELKHRRLETLVEALRDIPPHEKVVIWARWHYDIEGIHQVLTEKFPDQGVAEFHGKNAATRDREVQAFVAGRRFFVATPASGGHGLNDLVCASYVVFYNNGFKYSERLQAEDRNSRIGQTRPVVYTDIVCADTIDERIQRALSKKEDVVESFRREVEKVKREHLRERLLAL
ncbi:MAG: DEAD/DEAH box helicase [Acidobacteria bacterium]|nr:DEAD/DEAH box helicase [Acidobacteriota bacterium]